MDSFDLGKQFDNCEDLLKAKRNYEQASNCILVITSSRLLKGDGDFVKSKVYDRLCFECKAGKERPCRGNEIRATSTYKMNCPFKVSISLLKNKLTVYKVNHIHENHQTDRKTFLAYPENVRLTDKEKEIVKPMLACGASKQKVKAFLSTDREADVTLRVLHNFEATEKQQRQSCNRKDDLRRLIEMMMANPNAKVRLIRNENNDLIGVLFQDERMAHFYDKYPEILFFDATHKLNNLDLPLFIQLCVDGNGDSKIISLYVCVGESIESVGSMIDEFQKMNPSHVKTKVILGDKDFVDRQVYLEKFLNAVLKICIFHVQRTFRREITVHKRGITNDQREAALKVLQRLVYSTSEEEYDSVYIELLNLNLENVTEYYNNNWHMIRDEWTLFGINKHCSYLNTTNNRMESLNGKLKMVGHRNANLQTFFENLTISISNISSEKDHSTLRATMRRSRQCYEDPILTQYKDFLTEFSFKKIEMQYELATRVEFSSIEEREATVKNKNNDKVSATRCSCIFFSSMDLPCRHILKFLIVNEMDLFVPQLCAVRWTKDYYKNCHPALLSHIQINNTKPVYVQVLDKNLIDRYKKSHTITKDVRNIALNLSSNEQDFYLSKLNQLRDEMLNSSANRIAVFDQCVDNPVNLFAGDQENIEREEEMPLDLSTNHQLTSTNNSTMNQQLAPGISGSVIRTDVERRENSLDMRLTSINNSTMSQQLSPVTRDNSSTLNSTDIENIPTSSQHSNDEVNLSVFRQSQQLAILSSIENVKVPAKVVSVGRPKGTDKTVIGIKRKKRDTSKSVKKINEDVSLKEFANKTLDEQAVTIIKWLTQKEFNESKIITFKEIVRDNNVFQRLRNDDVFLGHLKKFMDNEAFEYVKNEVNKLHTNSWICSKCNLVLNGTQVQCNICLDWFHFQCVQDPSSKRHFVCSSC